MPTSFALAASAHDARIDPFMPNKIQCGHHVTEEVVQRDGRAEEANDEQVDVKNLAAIQRDLGHATWATS